MVDLKGPRGLEPPVPPLLEKEELKMEKMKNEEEEK